MAKIETDWSLIPEYGNVPSSTLPTGAEDPTAKGAIPVGLGTSCFVGSSTSHLAKRPIALLRQNGGI